MTTKPKHASIDADSLIYAAAVAGQNTAYVLYDKNGRELKRFRKHKEWVQFQELIELEFEQLPVPLSETELKKETVALSFNKCTKSLNKLLKQWVKLSGCESYTCYIGDPACSDNFRNEIATILPYKGNRSGREKPVHLQQLREYAVNLPHFRAVSGIEADDASLAAAEDNGRSGCLVAIDKDARSVVGCWFINPEAMKEPVYSPRNTVGYVELKSNGKMTGLGYMHVLAQCLTGDVADNVQGLPRFGAIKTVKLLEPYNNLAWVERSKAVQAVMNAYEAYYGERYEYKHWCSGETITRSWREMLDENFLLLWMQRSNDKTGEVLARYWRQ